MTIKATGNRKLWLTVSTEAGTERTVRGMYATALQFPKPKYETDDIVKSDGGMYYLNMLLHTHIHIHH